MKTTGTLPEIVRNDHGMYEGNLVPYFQVVFNYAQNLNHPYHNFRHMFHVVWLCYQACSYYGGRLTPRERRDLLVAAMFHDFDHSGLMGNDDLNIERAIRGFEKHIQPQDLMGQLSIITLIRATEFPYRVPSERLPLSAQVIRDADMGQAFSTAWLQQVVFGLAAEWGKKPFEVLKAQSAFHRNLTFHTAWGRALFSQEAIDAKIAEAEELVALLEKAPPL